MINVYPGTVWVDPISHKKVYVKSVKGRDLDTLIQYVPEGTTFSLTVPYHAFVRFFKQEYLNG